MTEIAMDTEYSDRVTKIVKNDRNSNSLCAYLVAGLPVRDTEERGSHRGK